MGDRRRKQGGAQWVRGLGVVLEPLVVAIERVGLPGVVLLLAYLFVTRYASADQKREIVDLYVLGKGLEDTTRLLVVGALGALIILAQGMVCSRRQAAMQREIDRLAEWKTAHQQALTGSSLHPSRGRGK